MSLGKVWEIFFTESRGDAEKKSVKTLGSSNIKYFSGKIILRSYFPLR